MTSVKESVQRMANNASDILGCELCAEVSLTACHNGLKGPAGRRVCFQSPGHVVMPSLGPLVYGHLLLLPREHVTGLAFEDETKTQALLAEVDALALFCAERLGTPVLFEHGARSGVAAGGCGVSHAHLHAVPAKEGDVPCGPPLLPGVEWEEVGPRSWPAAARDVSLRNGSYLYFRDQSRGNYVGGVRSLPSQTLRKYVAECIGQPAWDWRADAQMGVVLKSAGRLCEMPPPLGFTVVSR
jgi:diadenosine tetraphosphate (Ap4A) HIT family hydrolase